MIHLAVPNLTGQEKNYLESCIDTTFVSSVGEFVNHMEELVAFATGSQYAVATSAGTTGLHVALMAVGVKPGEIVIIPTFTFIATANAVSHCGAIPWLIDINEDDWCINVNLVHTEIQKHCKIDGGKLIHINSNRRVAAIMPVYTLGNIPDMEIMRSVADEYDLPLVADAACAIGATYKGKSFGALADLSVLSFNGNKTITCGGGGMVVGNDEKLLKLVRHLTTTARLGSEYDFDMVGFNYRMTNLQAAVGCAQMERLDEFVERKRQIRRYYESAIEDMKDVISFPTTEGSSCWFSGIVLPPGRGIEDVRKFVVGLKEENIEARTFWKPIHLQKPYRDVLRGNVSAAESIWNRIVTLPCSTNITDTELEKVKGTLKEISEKILGEY